jgi:hypothetical protein
VSHRKFPEKMKYLTMLAMFFSPSEAGHGAESTSIAGTSQRGGAPRRMRIERGLRGACERGKILSPRLRRLL